MLNAHQQVSIGDYSCFGHQVYCVKVAQSFWVHFEGQIRGARSAVSIPISITFSSPNFLDVGME